MSSSRCSGRLGGAFHCGVFDRLLRAKILQEDNRRQRKIARRARTFPREISDFHKHRRAREKSEVSPVVKLYSSSQSTSASFTFVTAANFFDGFYKSCIPALQLYTVSKGPVIFFLIYHLNAPLDIAILMLFRVLTTQIGPI